MKKVQMVPAFGLLIIAWAVCAVAQNHAPVAVIKVTSGQTITDNRIKVNANKQVCFDGLSSAKELVNHLTECAIVRSYLLNMPKIHCLFWLTRAMIMRTDELLS